MRFLLLLAVWVVALAVSGCTSTSEGLAEYRLAEFSVVGPNNISSDLSSVTAVNDGDFPHTLVITDSEGNVVAATDLINPGDSVDLEVVLGEGQYQFTCRIVTETGDGEIIDHYESGMVESVRVSN